jgi:Inner membrane component of T3SS, cytoplasmic domain
LKFEVRYPTGARHDVTLEGTLAVIGRDPSCDLVLNDVKCSRRHAVIEAGPQGMAIRDSGSANGVHVNGKRIERSVLEAGDVIRVGEIIIKVLPEEVGGTVVMGPDELEPVDAAPTPPPRAQGGPVSLGTPLPGPGERSPSPRPARAPAAAPPPPARRPAEARPPSTPRGPVDRPLTLTLLSVFWAVATLLYLAAAIYLGLNGDLGTWTRAGGAALMLFLALVGIVLAFGLWMRHGWARMAQITIAAIGLLNCPFTLAAVVVLVYLMRAEVRLQFRGKRGEELDETERALIREESAEGPFSATLIGTVLVGALALVFLLWWGHKRIAADSTAGLSEAAVLADMHELAEAQRNFREGTAGSCPSGFADLDGLMKPFGVIPGYRSDGPVFLAQTFAQEQRYGYRFKLETDDPVPERDGCPKRMYQRFRYFADPSASGRHFVTGPDGVVHVAPDRPASLGDPSL